MPETTNPVAQSPLPGRATWMDLATHDIEGARTFYSEMFGWTFLDQGADFGGYQMAQLDGGFVAGAMSSLMGPTGPTETPQMPTCWTVYLHVADIDEALAKVAPAGGAVMVPAMTVGEAGRMAVVTDPAGAVVGMWQPLEFAGFDNTMAPGTPVWFESLSKDFDAALAFYTEVFGWDVSFMGSPEKAEGTVRYATNGNNELACAGLCEASSFLPEQVPSFWRAYLLVENTDQACEKLKGLGGTVVDGPMDSPFGRLATVTDPQGASFQIIQPADQTGWSD